MMPSSPARPLVGHFCFNVNWGLVAREELLRLGQILSHWRHGCRWLGDDPVDVLRDMRTFLKVSDEDVELLKSVGLLGFSRMRLGVQTFHDMSPRKAAEVAAESEAVCLHTKARDCDDDPSLIEFGPDVEAIARLLALVMCRYPKETDDKLVFTFAETHFLDGEDASAKGGVAMVTINGYRIQTLRHLSDEIREYDFWIDDDVAIVLRPATSYRLPEKLIAESERRLASVRSLSPQP